MEYPKMLYRPGKVPPGTHDLADKPLKIDNRHECELRTVDNADEEAAALSEGWSTSFDPEAAAAEAQRQSAIADRDAEIAALRAELAARDAKPRVGRPPNPKPAEVTDGDAA